MSEHRLIVAEIQRISIIHPNCKFYFLRSTTIMSDLLQWEVTLSEEKTIIFTTALDKGRKKMSKKLENTFFML